MSIVCPYCKGTGRISERGRFYRDRCVISRCECQPRPPADDELEILARDRDRADQLMAEAHPMKSEQETDL